MRQVTILNTDNLQLYDMKYSYLIQIIFQQIFFTNLWDHNQVSVYLEVMMTKGYSTIHKYPELESVINEYIFSVIFGVGGNSFVENTVCIF